jgi:ankyrin repeat protein
MSDPRVNPAAQNDYAVRWAARNGHLEVLQFLMSDPRVNPAADDNYAVCWAAQCGHLEVLQFLVSDPRVNPAAKNNYAMRGAAENGHSGVVEFLVDCCNYIDPDKFENKLIKKAIAKRNAAILKRKQGLRASYICINDKAGGPFIPLEVFRQIAAYV